MNTSKYAENEKVPAHAQIVEEGGGDYVCSNAMNDGLVLFNSRQTGSTLALPEKDLTPEAVRVHIVESNCKFGVKATVGPGSRRCLMRRL